jgi:hypothetical protein
MTDAPDTPDAPETPEELVFGSQFMLFMIADRDPTLEVHYLFRRAVPIYRRAKLLHRRMISERQTVKYAHGVKHQYLDAFPFLVVTEKFPPGHGINRERTHIRANPRLCLPAIEIVVYSKDDKDDVDAFIFAPGLNNRRALSRGDKLKWSVVMPSEYDVWLRLAEHMIETFAPRPLLQIP